MAKEKEMDILIQGMVITATPLESFTASDGRVVEYRKATIRYNNQLLNFSVLPTVDLSQHVDKEVTLQLELRNSQNKAAVRIVGVVE